MNQNDNIMNDVIDNLIDDLISKAAPIAEERMIQEIEIIDHEFSDEYMQKMNKLFARGRRQDRMKSLSHTMIRVAAVLLLVVTLATVTIYSVEAWRIRFQNFVIDLRRDRMIIDFNDELDGDVFEMYDLHLGYIPGGFVLDQSFAAGPQVFMRFANEDLDLDFRITVTNIVGALAIDTEDAAIKRTQVNGFDAFFSTNDNVNILVWHDHIYSYQIAGTISENEIMRIAENIRR